MLTYDVESVIIVTCYKPHCLIIYVTFKAQYLPFRYMYVKVSCRSVVCVKLPFVKCNLEE